MNEMLISVVIPVYNGGKKLDDTLKSVVFQSYGNLEIIVVDDGSEEDIESLILKFQDKRISYYKSPHRNANVARNFGILKSKGKYIAMLDSDDLWETNHIQDCLDTIEKKGVDGIYGSLKLLNVKTNTIQSFTVRLPFENETVVDYLLKKGFGAQTSTLFMTATAAKTVQWDEKLLRHQDYDFVIRFCSKFHIGVKEEPTVIYRIFPGVKKINFDSCICFLEKYKNQISPVVYSQYCKNMYALACSHNTNSATSNYYRKEYLKFKEYITYYDYIAIMSSNSFWSKVKLKIMYIWRIWRVQENSFVYD